MTSASLLMDEYHRIRTTRRNHIHQPENTPRRPGVTGAGINERIEGELSRNGEQRRAHTRPPG